MFPEIPYPGFTWQITQHTGIVCADTIVGLLRGCSSIDGQPLDIPKIDAELIKLGRFKSETGRSIWRDYQQILSEFGFIYSSAVSSDVLRLTPVAKELIEGRMSFSEALTMQLLRYQYPNGFKKAMPQDVKAPDGSDASSFGSLTDLQHSAGVRIKPFSFACAVLDRLGQMTGKTESISVDEMEVCLLRCSSYDEVEKCCDEIVKLRDGSSSLTSMGAKVRRNASDWMKLLGATNVFSIIPDGRSGRLSLSELSIVHQDAMRWFMEKYNSSESFWNPESEEEWFAFYGKIDPQLSELVSNSDKPLGWLLPSFIGGLKMDTKVKIDPLPTADAIDGKSTAILAAIRAKPFILLAGMSGTGKTRIVRQLARGCCPTDSDLAKDPDSPGNYKCIPVRPNWHDSTELMGYVTRLTENNRPKYVLTPFVKFLVKAWLHKDVPFFLCLDEMNLAPVEQYFSEYLSKIETRRPSGGEIVTDVLVEFPDEILDSALSEISREIPLMAMTKHPGADEKPETKKRDKDTLYKLWDDFLTNWPISRLREIGLEEYAKAGSTTTFTYALEVKLADLGSIWGGSAFKFGIFSRDPNGKMKDYNPNSKQIGTNEYAWYRKFGVTKEAAWNAVKEKIVSVAEAAANGHFAAIDKIDFPHIVKWKIAFLYQDRKNIKIVDIYKKEWVVLLTSGMPRNATFAERYLKLNEDRKDMDVFEWDDKILTKRRAELLGSDDDFDSDEEEESNPVNTMVQSPVLEMVKRDNGIRIPPNLVVMGTVNMDETTCSFPRKVLDRAMTFELNEFDVDSGLESNPDIALGSIDKGLAKCSFTHGWQVYAANKGVCDKLKPYLVALDKALKGEHGTPSRFAYRTRDEFMAYCVERIKDNTPLSTAADEATGMKILSRIEGDQDAVRAEWLENVKDVVVDGLKKLKNEGDPESNIAEDKLKQMLKRLSHGSTSFWL